MRKLALFGAGLAVLVANSADAHHPGGGGNAGGAGPIVTISAETLEQGHSSVAVMFELTRIRAFSDAQLINFASKHVHAHSMSAIIAPSIAAAYGITNDLMLSARLPYHLRTDIREGHHSHGHGGHAHNTVVERGDADGIGDLSAMLQYRLVNNRAAGSQWALLGGVKAPTGRTGVNDNNGVRFEQEFQPGSGSWDWMFGLAATQRAGRFSLDANVLYTVMTEGDQNTDLGDRFQYNLAVSYRIAGGSPYSQTAMHLGARRHALGDPMHHGAGRSLKDDHVHEEKRGLALDVMLELNGEWHDREKIAGAAEVNSGGTVVFLAPGARLSGDRWSGFVSMGVPIVRNLNGAQVEPDYRLLTGVSVSF